MNTFFSSDYHFYHNNIIRYQSRPFDSVEEMNQGLIDNNNSVVGKKDTLYIVGDIAIGATPLEIANILNQMNGRKILIVGNHDIPFLKHADFTSCFAEIHHLLSIKLNKQYIQLCHYPLEIWDRAHYGSFMLHGHSHGNLPDNPNKLRIDVGVDAQNYMPLSFEDVQSIMEKKEYVQYIRPHNRNRE